MEWTYSILSGIFGALSLALNKKMRVKRNFKTTVLFIFGISLSMAFLWLSMGTLPMSKAFVVWVGISASLEGILEMISKGKLKDWKRLTFIAMILGATIGFVLIP